MRNKNELTIIRKAIDYLESGESFEWTPINTCPEEVYDALAILPTDYDYVDHKKIIEEKGLAIEDMDRSELAAICTSIIRAERFCDGAISGCIDDGTVLRLLKRLEVLDTAPEKESLIARHFDKK